MNYTLFAHPGHDHNDEITQLAAQSSINSVMPFVFIGIIAIVVLAIIIVFALHKRAK